jgi:hypothetical protein
MGETRWAFYSLALTLNSRQDSANARPKAGTSALTLSELSDFVSLAAKIMVGATPLLNSKDTQGHRPWRAHNVNAIPAST